MLTERNRDSESAEEPGEDEKHRFAFDPHGKWVNAKKTNKMKYVHFTCGCPGKHRMKLNKPSGLPGKRPFSDYFSHVTPAKKHKQSGQQDQEARFTCRGGGESETHRRAKHILRESVGSYYFTISRCRCCNCEVVQDTAGCTVSMEISSEDRHWRYDCLLKKDDLAVVAMEVVHTHQSGAAKINAVRASGLEIVEFRAEDVISMEDGSNSNELTKLENIKIRTEVCHDCLMSAPYKEERVAWGKTEDAIFIELLQQFTARKQMQEERRRREEQEKRRRRQEEEKLQQQKNLEEEKLQQQKNFEVKQRKKHQEQEDRRARLDQERTEKESNMKQTELTALANLMTGLPSLIYTSVYHPPNGSPSWTPYEMTALKKTTM
jgi:hypothetical protein